MMLSARVPASLMVVRAVTVSWLILRPDLRKDCSSSLSREAAASKLVSSPFSWGTSVTVAVGKGSSFA